MPAQVHEPDPAGLDAAADHITEARQRARQVLSSEAHLGAVDDWRRVLVSARDAVILVWLVWVALHAYGDPPFTAWMLTALAIGLALLCGISTGRSTYMQLEYYTSELDRERMEIRENFDGEREEVRALYAAKGFREPLLGQIVDTLCSDDDRLLKVMMEEELGLLMYHVPHPVVVGLWNFGGSLVAGLTLAWPLAYLTAPASHLWMPIGGVVLLAIIAVAAAKATQRRAIEFFATGVVTAAITGGVVYFLSQWFSGFLAGTVTPGR